MGWVTGIGSFVFALRATLHQACCLGLRSLASAVVIAAVIGCGAPAQPAGERGRAEGAVAVQARTPQRALTMVFSREPESLEPSRQPQNREWSALASGFLAYFNREHQAVPLLAEDLPTVEKGTWKVLTDGRMETTYRIKRNATWHDGQPITAHDWAFAFKVRVDPEFPSHHIQVERKLAQAVALDDHTLFLEWREPFLWAGMVYLPYFPPVARHKLEALYVQDKIAFIDSAYWREEFVGSGPYRLVGWEPGVEMVFRAHPGFVLGKPAIDEVRVRFMADANTIVANLLSGGIDLSISPYIGFAQGQALEQAAWGGRVEYWPGLPRFLEYQGREWPNTHRVVFDRQIRQASHYAIDRQSIVDSIFAGRGVVAWHWVAPIDPAYSAVMRALPRYEYNPARAEALLREAGWVKGADGRARNAAGEALYIPIQTLPPEDVQLDAAVIVDNWRAVGIASEIHRLSAQEWRDNELRSKVPAVAYNIRGGGLMDMVWLGGANVSGPENRWAGQNRTGYVNPRLDDLWSKVLGTIDPGEREGHLIEAARVMIDDAMVVLILWTPDVMAHNADLLGVAQYTVTWTSPIWNLWEWRWR